MATSTAPGSEPINQHPTQPPPIRGLGRSWRVGRDLTSWPVLKIAQAARHARELESRLQIWTSNDPVTTVGKLAEDRKRWELRLKVCDRPPILEWALVLGDCLHNLRSSLDGLVWQLAHVDGATPPNPKMLQFPIVRERSKWADAKKRNLQTVPDEVAARIEIVQPFNLPAEQAAKDALVVLSDLNNRDKHRSNLVVQTALSGVHQRVRASFEDPKLAARNMPPQLAYYQPPIEDDALLLEYTTQDRLESVDGDFSLLFQFMLETEHGSAEVLTTLQQLIGYVGSVAGLIMYGPPDPSREGWTDMTFREDGNRMVSGN